MIATDTRFRSYDDLWPKESTWYDASFDGGVDIGYQEAPKEEIQIKHKFSIPKTKEKPLFKKENKIIKDFNKRR